MNKDEFHRLGLLFAIAFAVAIPAQAQLTIEEVLVTARKKEESIQKTPVAISAVTEETIQASFLGNATGIVQYSPNLIFDQIDSGTPGGGSISIRGVSLQDVEKTFDPTVLIHVDGVPLGTNSGNAMSMIDVERIEVLRGPQGTLFGKNAVGGVINIFRKKPIVGQFAGKARVRMVDGDAWNFEGVLNVPLGENFAAKLNVASLETVGFYENVTTGNDDGESEEMRFGIHLLWQPTDDFRAEFQYNKSDWDGLLPPVLSINSPADLLCFAFGACAVSPDLPLSGDRTRGAGDLPGDFYFDTWDAQIDLNWQINDKLDAVLIAAHRDIDESGLYDFDGSPIEIFHVWRPSKYEQDSVEVRLYYDNDDRFSITGGYFYWNSELPSWRNELDISLFLGLPVDACGLDGVACQVQLANASSKSRSFFFEGDYNLTDQWIMTVGARYIEEKKTMFRTDTLPIFGLVTLPPTHGERTDDDVIYRLGLRWEPRDDLMTYLAYSTGFRSGGFSIRAATPAIVEAGYEPETVDNIELGLKTTMLDNRLRLNLTLFHMNWDNMQIEVNIPVPGLGSGQQDAVLNVGKATMQGVEVELTALLGEYFSLDFNLGYLDTKYDKFNGKVFADQAFGADNSDLELRRAPKWNYTAALNYQQEIGEGALTGRVSYNWRDDYQGTVSNFPGSQIDSFGLLDASLSYNLGQWRIGVFGRNLTDEDAYQHTFVVAPNSNGSSLFTFANSRPPRHFGVEVTYTFGDY